MWVASLSQSPASSHHPWISCGAFPPLNATSSPDTAHFSFNQLVGIFFNNRKKKVCSTVSDSATPWLTRLLHPWNFLGKSAGVGCHFLLQGIFPTQGSNLGLPQCGQTLYHLSHQGINYSLPLFWESQNWIWTMCVTSLADRVLCIVLDAVSTHCLRASAYPEPEIPQLPAVCPAGRPRRAGGRGVLPWAPVLPASSPPGLPPPLHLPSASFCGVSPRAPILCVLHPSILPCSSFDSLFPVYCFFGGYFLTS